jgi:GDP-D-mannose dehydratase
MVNKQLTHVCPKELDTLMDDPPKESNKLKRQAKTHLKELAKIVVEIEMEGLEKYCQVD